MKLAVPRRHATSNVAASVLVMNPRSMSVSFGPKPPPRGEDLPCDDGEPMETQRHKVQASILADTLDDAWAHRRDVYIGANMAVYFSETQALKNDFRAPDVFVVLDTERRERKRWVVWEEDGRTPDVVIELTSESTEDVDRGLKKTVYARMLHVPIYVIYDPFSARLDVYRLSGTQYEPIAPDAQGRVFCEPLRLYLGIVPGTYRDIEAPWLRWIDRDGIPLPLPTERLAHITERAAREAERADRAEMEVARLREELRRRGG